MPPPPPLIRSFVSTATAFPISYIPLTPSASSSYRLFLKHLFLLPSSFSHSPLCFAANTSFPYSSFKYPNLRQQQPSHFPPALEDDDEDGDEEELVIGDCLVFDEGAFEDGTGSSLFEPPRQSVKLNSGNGIERSKKKKKPGASAEAAEVEPESLVPEKWKEVVQEINLNKKEKRKISHELKFGSRMEQRKVSRVPDMEEYRTYREMKLAQLKPVVLDDPPGFLKEKEEMVEPPEPDGLSSGRVVPRNPRLGLGGGTLDDITDFFNSGKYVPRGTDDDSQPQGRRKLFTREEKFLLNKRIPNLAEASSCKWLPLHSLAASGEFYLLDTLLKHNVDINAVDGDGLSAIHKAILCKKQAIINYLLRNSANPFIRDKDGATLMHYAVQTASSQTIKILLLYNVDINLSDNDGWTPLHLAVQTQRTDIIRLLLIKGADKTLKNQDGLTPLDLCLYSGHGIQTFELIKLLKQ